MYVRELKRKRETECVCLCERVGARERVFVSACVKKWEQARECVCVRERD